MKIIPFSSNVVNYGESGWSTILDKVNTVEVSETFKKAYNDISKFTVFDKPEKWVDWAKSMGYADKELKNFLSDVDSGKRDIKDMGLYMDQASTSTTRFSSSLKSMVANIAITLAVVATIKLVTTAWDKLNTTLEEYQEKVDTTTSKLEEYRSELAEIQKYGVSSEEQSRAEYLERMIELYESLYDSQMKALYASKLFGEDDLMSGGLRGENLEELQEYGELLDNIKSQNDFSKIETAKIQIEMADSQNLSRDGLLEGALSDIEAAEDRLRENRDSIKELVAGWYEDIDTYQLAIDSGYLDRSKVEEAQSQIDKLKAYIESAEKEIGTIELKIGVDFNIGTATENLKRSITDGLTANGLTTADGKENVENYVTSLSEGELEALYNETKRVGEMTLDEAKNFVKQYNKTFNEVEIPDYKDTLASISTLASELDTLSSIFDDVKNKEDFDFSSLTDDNFVQAFAGYTDEYDNFIKTVSESPTDINACQGAFDDLATAWVNGSGILDDLTEGTRNATINMLEQKGVANATEIVDYQLAKSKAAATAATLDMSASEEVNLAIMREALSVYGLTGTAVNDLSIAYYNAQIAMSEAMSSGALSRLGIAEQEFKAISSLADAYSLLGGVDDARGEAALWGDSDSSKILNFGSIKDRINKLAANVSGYSGGISSSGGSGSKTDPYKAEIDALKKYTDAYEEAQARREAIDKKYDNADTTAEKVSLLNDRIKAMEDEQKAIEDLNDARDKEIEKNVELLRAKGFKVSYDPTSDKLQIENLEHLNELKGKDQEDTNKLIKEYEDMISETEDMAKANKDLAVTWQDNIYSIHDLHKELLKLREDLHDEKITDIEFKISVAENLGDVNKQIEGLTNKITTTINDLNEAYAMGLDSTSDYVQSLIKDLMDAANDIKDVQKKVFENKRNDYDSAKNAVIGVIDDNIKALQKEKEALQKVNDEQDRAIKLSQLKEALAKAKETKIHVYRKGQG